MNNKKIWSWLLVVSLSFASPVIVQAQNNYANVKVDELSDDQIKQMILKANEMGYTDAQLEQVMVAQGMSPQEAAKLRQRAEQIRKGAASIGNATVPDAKTASETGQLRSVSSDTVSKQKTVVPKSRIFGSDLFSNGAITFEPNMKMATPKNYVIGPDDQLLLDLTGDNIASYKLPVSPEGVISLEYVGRITVGGLTIDQATNKIRAAMAGTYPALRTGRSQIALNLGNIRSIKIVITGEVNKPGTYTLPSLATVFNALYASGGPNERGSFRAIQVIRNNTVVGTIDVYDFLVKGMQTGSIRLQDQDVINVPVYHMRVDVVGEVKRSAIFETLQGESFTDILRFAGGFSDAAYSARVKIFQNTPTERKIIDISSSEFSTYHPTNGDKIFVEPILDRIENRVEIRGAVYRPGTFELSKGLSLSHLIQQADGLREDAFMNRGYIIRLNADNTSSLSSFDVAEIMRNPAADIMLQREDIVQISSIFDLREEYKVTIAGEVRNPGTFNYAERMSVKDLIQMAGGFKEGATSKRIEVSRRVRHADLSQFSAPTAEIYTISLDSALGLNSNEFVLNPFDIVSIRLEEGFSIQQQVKVEGEVLYPGIYTIKNKNERISDIIKRAGGLTVFAFPEGASLKRKTAGLDSENERIRLLNMERMKQSTNKEVGDSSTAVSEELLTSNLVGIELEKVLKKPKSRYDLVVEEGDIIRIPKMLQTVKVTGEVLRPTNVVYVPGMPFNYYINAAGGFTKKALKRNAFITYANGSAAGTQKSLFINNYPKVKPGAEVAIPRRADRERMDAQGWVGITSTTISLVAMIFAIFKK